MTELEKIVEFLRKKGDTYPREVPNARSVLHIAAEQLLNGSWKKYLEETT